MTLGKKQKLFTFMVAELIKWAYDEGYEITLGDAYRDPRVFGKVGIQDGMEGRTPSIRVGWLLTLTYSLMVGTSPLLMTTSL